METDGLEGFNQSHLSPHCTHLNPTLTHRKSVLAILPLKYFLNIKLLAISLQIIFTATHFGDVQSANVDERESKSLFFHFMGIETGTTVAQKAR